jgi:hypothetical protein
MWQTQDAALPLAIDRLEWGLGTIRINLSRRGQRFFGPL